MSNTLRMGQSLTPGQKLTSNNGTYTMTLQTDGNFVLYKGTTALWSSDTQGKASAKVTMQDGGDLQVLDASGNVLWHSDTPGEPGGFLILQEDGNAVIYRNPIWATNTAS